MEFLEINTTSTYTNTSGYYLVLQTWNGSFVLQDPSGTAASGTINAYTANNSTVIVPPNWKLSTTSLVAQAMQMSMKELATFLLGVPS